MEYGEQLISSSITELWNPIQLKNCNDLQIRSLEIVRLPINPQNDATLGKNNGRGQGL